MRKSRGDNVQEILGAIDPLGQNGFLSSATSQRLIFTKSGYDT